MGVPTEGSYKMFDTGSNASPITSSIKGAQKHKASDPVDGNTNFTHNITDAQIPYFDPQYAGDINSLSDITGSIQFRGYPQEVSCYTCSFEEIGDPNNRTIIVSASALEDGVSFRTRYGSTYSPFNGGIEISTTRNSTIGLQYSDIGSDETFVGWSLTEDGTGNILSNSSTYLHTVNDEITIYALARLSDAIGVDFCYYNTSNMNTICSPCSTTKTVYFDRDDFASNPLEDLIWYENASLTVKSDQGYYRQKTTQTYTWLFGLTYTRTIVDDTIFFVSGSTFPIEGAANVYDTCGNFIYCNNS
jgi:hypothetical protein